MITALIFEHTRRPRRVVLNMMLEGDLISRYMRVKFCILSESEESRAGVDGYALGLNGCIA